jgi:hypothetical protein
MVPSSSHQAAGQHGSRRTCAAEGGGGLHRRPQGECAWVGGVGGVERIGVELKGGWGTIRQCHPCCGQTGLCGSIHPPPRCHAAATVLLLCSRAAEQQSSKTDCSKSLLSRWQPFWCGDTQQAMHSPGFTERKPPLCVIDLLCASKTSFMRRQVLQLNIS